MQLFTADYLLMNKSRSQTAERNAVVFDFQLHATCMHSRVNFVSLDMHACSVSFVQQMLCLLVGSTLFGSVPCSMFLGEKCFL